MFLVENSDCQFNSFFRDTNAPIVFAPVYDAVTVSIPNNFWNTTDRTVIDSMISDSHDSLSILGTVDYEPILAESDPGTPILD